MHPNTSTNQLPQQPWANVILFYSKDHQKRAARDLKFRSGVFAGQIGGMILVTVLFLLEWMLTWVI